MNEQRYIDLLKLVLTDLHRIEHYEYKPIYTGAGWKKYVIHIINKQLRGRNLVLCKAIKPKREDRVNGLDWPANAETMIGLKRLENIEYCIKKIIENNIPGDLIETGVWRGGASIFMKAVLKTSSHNDRKIWLADSFLGLPKPDESIYEKDVGDEHYLQKELKVSLESVKNNFSKFDLLDDNIMFLEGWFKDTLPLAPIEKLALIRLDGDMYESTMDGIYNLYPKLSKGGFLIVDDWGAVKGCQDAIMDYRTQFNISDTIVPIDQSSVYWVKTD
ncbi:MAG: TylF/MycF/NovP-related O-methyltransferase [Saprospiraceae bacterium]